MSISKILLACGLAIGSLSLATAPAAAAVETKPAAKKPVKKATAQSKTKAKKAVEKPVVPKEPNPEEDEPVITDSSVTEFDCELGNKVAIYQNVGDDEHIALRWKKRLHRLTRVGTTTGAQRFENKLYGLIWIGIPAKSMLLDSKLNRQLANECRNPEQLQPVAVTEKAPEAPATAVQ